MNLNRTLFVSSLDPHIRKRTLFDVFEPFGKIIDLQIVPLYKKTSRPHAIAFVEYDLHCDARAAWNGVRMIDGKTAVIRWSRHKWSKRPPRHEPRSSCEPRYEPRHDYVKVESWL